MNGCPYMVTVIMSGNVSDNGINILIEKLGDCRKSEYVTAIYHDCPSPRQENDLAEAVTDIQSVECDGHGRKPTTPQVDRDLPHADECGGDLRFLVSNRVRVLSAIQALPRIGDMPL